MSVAWLWVLALVSGGTVAAILRFGFGVRGTDFLYLLLAALPALWMSRLNLYSVTLGESPFFLLWWLLGGGALVLIWFGRRGTRELFKVPFRKVAVPLFALFCVLTASNAVNAESDADIIRGLHASCAHLSAFVAAWVLARCCRMDEDRFPQLVLGLLLVGTGIGVMGVLSALMPALFRSIVQTEKTVLETGRAFSPIGGPAATAMSLLLAYFLACGQLMGGKRRLLSATVMALCFVGLLTTLARAAILSFAITHVYLLAALWRGMGRRSVVPLAAAALVLTPAALGLSRSYSLERLVSDVPGQPMGRSIEARSMSMKAALYFGMNHPWLGGGWGLVYPYARDDPLGQGRVQLVYLDGHPSFTKPHTLLGLIFAEGGFPALILLGLYFWGTWKCLEPPDVAVSRFGFGVVVGTRAGLLSFAAMCVVQDTVFTTTKLALYYYLFMFLGMAVSAYYRRSIIPTPRGFVMPQTVRWPNRLGGPS